MEMSVNPDFKQPLIIADKAPETVKIQSDETESGYVIINATDFDAKLHKKHVEKPSK